MEPTDVGGTRGEGPVDLHATVEGVVHNQIVCHADSVGLHWVSLAVVIIADSGLVEVGHAALFGVGTGGRERSPTGCVAHAQSPIFGE